MKKLISLFSVFLLLLSLSACGKFTCELCHKVKREKYEITIEGEKGTLCKECYEKLKVFDTGKAF